MSKEAWFRSFEARVNAREAETGRFLTVEEEHEEAERARLDMIAEAQAFDHGLIESMALEGE